MADIHKRLCQQREAKGLSAHECAKAAGLSDAYWQGLENGNRDTLHARYQVLISSANVLGAKPDDLFYVEPT
jgi:transcriptional regulator with XRE-family HTH domain